MTAVQTTWRGAVGRYWPLAVVAAVALLINPAIGAVTAVVLALWRWSQDRPVAMALVAFGALCLAYLVTFAAVRVA
jgi:hypothetical protein